jgi:thymidylate synthase (FAD)
MKVVSASYRIESNISDLLTIIERAGRTCYKSEDREINKDTAAKFVKMLIDRGHHSVLEHASMTIRFIVDRGVSHEIVRHRLASYSQESTRYCNYSKEKFGSEITVIDPSRHLGHAAYIDWSESVQFAEAQYFSMIDSGAAPQMARSVLPNSLKTELVMTANVREWRHFFSLRAARAAHPQMREVACPLLRRLRLSVPVLFDDVGDAEADQ